MWLITGLGNPGSQYADTRHNIGFVTLDALVVSNEAVDVSKSSFHGSLYKKGSLLFLKPQTFMNRSGDSVGSVASFYKIEPEKIIVIHDDLDLPFGALRFKFGGGNGGHNGLKSIDTTIGSSYLRVRLGIGKPEYKSQVSSYVLSPFGETERTYLSGWVKDAAAAALALTQHPLPWVASRMTCRGAVALS